jgi:flagella basal body P-ring formation protein FlgA
MRISSIGSILLLFSFAHAGVERFLQPISFPLGDDSSTRKHTSAYFSTQQYAGSSTTLHASSSSFTLDRLKLETKLSDLLKHRYQVDGKVLAFLGREWNQLEVGSHFQIKIRDCNPEELSANMFVRFSLWDKGIKLGDYSMPLRLAHMQGVLFSKVPLSRGAKPSDDCFEVKDVDILKNHANSVPATANLSGYQIDANVKPGSPLKWNLLTKTTLVEKGEIVNVFASGNGIYVTMKGIALEPGVKDSIVRVKNISSEKEFRAKVLDGNSVKVHL